MNAANDDRAFPSRRKSLKKTTLCSAPLLIRITKAPADEALRGTRKPGNYFLFSLSTYFSK